MSSFTPDRRPVVEWLYLDDNDSEIEHARWLAGALPHAAWTCHVVLCGGDPHGRFLEAVIAHLEREPVAVVHLHPVIVNGVDGPAALDRLLAAASHYQSEAYHERTVSRLVPLPIFEVPAGTDPRHALRIATAAAASLARPSLLLWNAPGNAVASDAAARGIRLHVGSRDRGCTTLEVLTAAHVFDSAMDRHDAATPLLDPCWPHEVVSSGRLWGCARQWRRQRSRGTLFDLAAPSWRPDAALCASCLAEAVVAMVPALDINRRRAEGRELALRTSAALLETITPADAAEVAAAAVELSDRDHQRADALVHLALCHLAGGRLAEADRSLLTAAKVGANPGLIATQRARVQVAWKDDIEALDRFAEAIELGSEAASEDDLHFEMALSHIRLEEWDDARDHLEQAGGPAAAISFNLGVCDLNIGEPERALGHFDRALELGPEPDDLGRVHFFRGACLKELGRHLEAVDELRRAIELERAELAHHNLLGFCLFKLGRHPEAVASFEAAVAIDPSSAIDWANLGVNLERLGDLERAAAMYRKALAIDPGIDFARHGLDRIGG